MLLRIFKILYSSTSNSAFIDRSSGSHWRPIMYQFPLNSELDIEVSYERGRLEIKFFSSEDFM